MSSIPTIKYINKFNVIGFSVRTQNSDEFNDKTAKIPSLWQQFYTSNLAGDNTIFGVYSNYDSDANGFYTLTVGVESPNIQPKFSFSTIPAGNYLVFEGKGPMPAAVIETWKQIWSYFQTPNNHRRTFITDFESYTGPEQVSIYIGTC